MGFIDSSDILQDKANDLFQGFKFICSYIDNLLVLTKGYWAYRVAKWNSL